MALEFRPPERGGKCGQTGLLAPKRMFLGVSQWWRRKIGDCALKAVYFLSLLFSLLFF